MRKRSHHVRLRLLSSPCSLIQQVNPHWSLCTLLRMPTSIWKCAICSGGRWIFCTTDIMRVADMHFTGILPCCRTGGICSCLSLLPPSACVQRQFSIADDVALGHAAISCAIRLHIRPRWCACRCVALLRIFLASCRVSVFCDSSLKEPFVIDRSETLTFHTGEQGVGTMRGSDYSEKLRASTITTLIAFRCSDSSRTPKYAWRPGRMCEMCNSARRGWRHLIISLITVRDGRCLSAHARTRHIMFFPQ